MCVKRFCQLFFVSLQKLLVVMTYDELWHRLLPLYDKREATAVVRTLLDGLFGFTLTDIVGDKVSELSADGQQELEEKMSRLEKGEPVQYVVGHAWFCGRSFVVSPSVLIPRPETKVLSRRVAADFNRPFCGLQPPKPIKLLDIGTGSGCIAVTLALDVAPSEVSAWDISPDALLVARDNAHRLGAKVNFECHDILDLQNLPTDRKFDVIVSNPPYVRDSERAAMERNVLDYEPSQALFVPDDNPLLFYNAITNYAAQALSVGGSLYFECNPVYVDKVADMLRDCGFPVVETFADQFDKERFVKGQL